MDNVQITAAFASAEQARIAVERLRSCAHESGARILREGTVQVAVPAAAVAQITRALRESGATDVAQAESASPGWMSHQDGRVTGTGVEPGAGDSEAGAG